MQGLESSRYRHAKVNQNEQGRSRRHSRHQRSTEFLAPGFALAGFYKPWDRFRPRRRVVVSQRPLGKRYLLRVYLGPQPNADADSLASPDCLTTDVEVEYAFGGTP